MRSADSGRRLRAAAERRGRDGSRACGSTRRRSSIPARPRARKDPLDTPPPAPSLAKTPSFPTTTRSPVERGRPRFRWPKKPPSHGVSARSQPPSHHHRLWALTEVKGMASRSSHTRSITADPLPLHQKGARSKAPTALPATPAVRNPRRPRRSPAAAASSGRSGAARGFERPATARSAAERTSWSPPSAAIAATAKKACIESNCPQ